METIWQRLLSGTDVRGVASGNQREITLTDDVVSAIARGYAGWLAEKTGKPCGKLKIGVGYDCRESSPRINRAVCGALSRLGASVFASGLSSTPAMFNMTVGMGLDGAIQITASHHPQDRNGMKFFTRSGGVNHDDLENILLRCEGEDPPTETASPGKITKSPYMPKYAAGLREIIMREVSAENYKRPLEGFKLAVDAGNGVGGFYAHDVLEPLGADISGSVFLEPDGAFPNHIPNPEDKTAMESVRGAVLGSGADLGIIFDTDVDRAAVVDADGIEINRNRLIALAAVIALEKSPGGTIVTDSVTSSGIKDFIEQKLGGKHYRYRRGYRNVITKAEELNAQGVDCPLAIETSGHAAMRENLFLDDGAYLVTKIIIKLAQLRGSGENLSELTAGLETPADEAEIRVPITAQDFRARGHQILESVKRMAETVDGWGLADDNREGIRVYEADGSGWFMLRVSVHDPLIPVNMESEKKNGCKHLARQILLTLDGFDGIDLQPLKTYCDQ